jgi:hypothetical protein
MNCGIIENEILSKCCRLNAVRIAAEIEKGILEGKPVSKLFPSLYRECYILSILDEWEKTEPSEDEELDAEDIATDRFIEIMTSKPETITLEMMEEAVSLFRPVFSSGDL